MNSKLLITVIAVSMGSCLCVPLQAQTTTASQTVQEATIVAKGQVVDQNGEPIIGAVVSTRDKQSSTITDTDGKFTLKVKPGAILDVSFIGYLTQSVSTENPGNMEIVMPEDAQALSEIVVIGYGEAKRRDFTGSVSSVRLQDGPLSLASNSNALESLKGSVAGLDVGYTNAAGQEPGLLVRGQNSISGSNSPLIVVDGVIYMGSLNDINPQDIASIDVLKDATSAAVYGSRAANGVICVTTKNGKMGKPIITFNANVGIMDWANKPNMMTSEQWLQSTMDRNGYSDPTEFLTGQQLENWQNGKTTDWLNFVSRRGVQQDYTAAISGASERVNYYLSVAYTDTKGIVKGDDYNRLTIKAKVDTKITNWLKLGIDASYTNSDYSGVGASLWGIQLMSPYAMPYRPNGELEKYPNGTNESVNPLWGVNSPSIKDNDWNHIYRLNGYARIDLPFVKGLSYRLNFSLNRIDSHHDQFTHESYYTYVGRYDDEDRYSSATQKNYLTSANGWDDNSHTNSWVVDNILNYTNSWGNHNIDITAVATRDSKHYKYTHDEGKDFLKNGNTTLGIDGLHFATTQKFTRSAWKQTNIGYLGRVSYNYRNTYYLTGSYRRDGASVFGSENKWGNFGAVGAAWRISQESFMRDLKFLNDLKLKVSWGRNGNQGIGAYTTLSQVSAGSSGGIKLTFDNNGNVVYGINQNTIGNKNLGWETTEAWNFGFESSWLNDRLCVDLDVYTSRTFDQLFLRTIPVMTGFSSIYASMGEVRNRGVELTIRTTNIRTRDFYWNTGLTFWLNRDKLTKLYGDDNDGDGVEDDDIGNNLFIGHSIHSIFGYQQDGIVQEGDTEYIEKYGVAVGTPKYVDVNGDGEINADDRIFLGNTNPSFRLNLSNTFNYKDFELYFMLAGNFGGSGYYQASNKAAYIIGGSGDFFGVNSIYVPYWTKENPSNVYPSATYTGDSRFKGLQSRSYVRLQDITLSYSFNNHKWLKAAKIANLKVFVTGKNIFTITKWKGGDPELGNSFVNGAYPVMRTVSFGANISF